MFLVVQMLDFCLLTVYQTLLLESGIQIRSKKPHLITWFREEKDIVCPRYEIKVVYQGISVQNKQSFVYFILIFLF
jgi:hypothetical protein